jgi:hypothetical protein
LVLIFYFKFVSRLIICEFFKPISWSIWTFIIWSNRFRTYWATFRQSSRCHSGATNSPAPFLYVNA